MIPCEHTSGKRQRLGKLTREGNALLRYLWTEATIHAVRKDPELKRSIVASLSRKGWARRGLQRRTNWVSACGSCCATRSTTKSSAAAESSGSAGKPMRECQITTVVLPCSDRVTE